MSESETQWLVDLYEEHGTSLHRLVVMLGAESESGHILRAALIGLARRAHRLVDPLERVEFLAEEVVHDARSTRGPLGSLVLPELIDSRQQEIQAAIIALPIRLGEILVISHYLSIFGPELAGILRMTVRSSNHRLEEGLNRLRVGLGDRDPAGPSVSIDSLSAEVTSALRASARLVQPPGTETLEAELRSLGGSTRSGVGAKVFVPLLAGALTLGFWLAAVSSPGAVEETLPPATQTAAPTASSSRSLPAQVRAVPVYYVAKSDLALYRELRNLAATGDLVRTAIESLFVVPPLDPDFDSLWSNGRLIDVELIGHQLKLNLSESAFEKLTTPELSRAAIDQMVYTASELLGDPELRVVFSSDGGEPPEDLRYAEGFGRRGLQPMPALWLSSPQNNAKVDSGQVVILGKVKPDAAAPLLRITDEDGDIVHSLTAQTATEPDRDGWRSWSVSVQLTPGEYSLVAVTQVTTSTGLKSVSENKSITVDG